jgi:hypothetical protein
LVSATWFVPGINETSDGEPIWRRREGRRLASTMPAAMVVATSIERKAPRGVPVSRFGW